VAKTRLIACVHESEVHRNADGSIDIDFYKERAQRLRRKATLILCRLIPEFIRAWLWNVRKARQNPRWRRKIAIAAEEEDHDA
jgi:hypothetical protein